jgi:hypothetical protein
LAPDVADSQFCSAYRGIVTVGEPVPWDNALIFEPTERAAGYLWYFPRTPTEINVGLGFQMTEEPMQLVEDLKRDLRSRPEFEGAEVTDKLGAALPTRRPYDSAVAPGYVAVGDAAGHVNPTTGGGIAGAAYAASAEAGASWGVSRVGHPPGSSVVEIDLIPATDGTLVRLTHRQLPPEETDLHEVGWSHYLDRLVSVAEGGDPGPDPGPGD